MKILVILSRIPWPLEKGDKLRAFHQIRCLAKNNEIILFALNDNLKLDQSEALRYLSPFCSDIYFFSLKPLSILWNLCKAFFLGKPLQAGYFHNRKAAKELQKLFKKTNPDHIYCQLIRTAEYGYPFNTLKTVDYQDAFSQGYLRRAQKASLFLKPFFYYEYYSLKRYEKKVFSMFDNHTIITKTDRDLLPFLEKESVIVVPNGIEHQYFVPQNSQKKYDLIFNGNLSYPPNIDAAKYLVRQILPIVCKTLPSTTVLLSGANPHKQTIALANDHVTVSGWVEDIRQNYAACRIFIAPMQIGIGLQNKLLEALCMKMPCITSSLANAALGADPESEVVIADTPESYAKHIVRLLSDEKAAQTLAEKGYQFVLRTFDWEKSTAILEKLMRKENH